ncbi:MAG: hypothetical protein ACLP9K_09670, partial [Nitrososphaerales archaeon]
PWRLDLYHPSQLRSQARSRKRELYAMKQGLEAHDLQSWEDVTQERQTPQTSSSSAAHAINAVDEHNREQPNRQSEMERNPFFTPLRLNTVREGRFM